MKSNRKSHVIKMFICLIFVLSVSTVSFGKTLEDSYKDYNVKTAYIAMHSLKCKESGAVLSLNTRPTTGTSGVKIWVAGSNGQSQTETFPYHTSRAAMTIKMKKNITYITHIAAISGTATGKLHTKVTI